jgi:hypothetical protein
MKTSLGEVLRRGDVVLNIATGREYCVVSLRNHRAWMKRMVDMEPVGTQIAFNDAKHVRAYHSNELVTYC